MDLPVLPASAPVSVPPVTTPGKVYDKLWQAMLVVNTSNLNGDGNADVELYHYMDLAQPSGAKEMAPGPSIKFPIKNIFATAAARAAAGKPALAQAMGAVLAAVIEIGSEPVLNPDGTTSPGPIAAASGV